MANTKKINDLTPNDFPGVNPVKFEEWKKAREKRNSNLIIFLIFFILLNIILLIALKSIWAGGLILVLIIALINKKYNKLSKELGIKPKMVRQALKSEIKYEKKQDAQKQYIQAKSKQVVQEQFISQKKSVVQEQFALPKVNYIYLGLGFVIIIIGFLLMTGGKSPDPNIFNEKEIFSFRRITLAPIVVMVGFLFEIWAIMKKPKVKE